MDEHPLKEYDFLPTLPELCERNFDELKEEVSYVFALYGFALGYLGGCHPAKAWLIMAGQLIRTLSEIEKEDWDDMQTSIADKLEERFLKGAE